MESAGGAAGSSGSSASVKVTIRLGEKIGAGDALVELLKHNAQPSTGWAQVLDVMPVSCVDRSTHPSGQSTMSTSVDARKNTSTIRLTTVRSV